MKKYLTHCLIALITMVAIFATFIWFVDPFMYFRAFSWHKPVYFLGWQRFQNVGIALNYNYNSVVIGTSMAENFSTNQMDKKLGWKTVNLAMSGSTAYEQRRLLELAIGTGKVKNVFWVVEWDSFAHPVNFVRRDTIFPHGLYEGDHAALLQYYLLNAKMLEFSGKVFIENPGNMDTAWYWGDLVKFGCAPVTDRYNDTSRDFVFRKALGNGDVLTDENSLSTSVKKNLSDVIRRNPSVKFYLIIPPYSKWMYKAFQEKFGSATLEAALNFRKEIAGQLGKFNNVTLSDYQSDIRIILDSNNYTDLGHYSPRINSIMIDEIGSGLFLPLQAQSKFLSQIKLQGNCFGE